MSKRISRIIAALLIIVLLAPIVPAPSVQAAAPKYRDIQGHWGESNINSWLNSGLAGGYPDGTFRPNQVVNRAEFISFLNRAFGYIARADIAFSDVGPADWFYPEVVRGIQAGYVSGFADGTFRPHAPVSRIDAAEMLYAAMRLSRVQYEDVIGDYTDNHLMSAAQRVAANAVVSEQLMVGKTLDTFSPHSIITRAETIAILDRAAGEIFKQAGTYGPVTGQQVINKNVTVSVRDVELRNMTIEGDLYLTEGIGDGDVTLDNVVVKGDTTIAGGGANSVKLGGTTTLPHVVITDPNGLVSVVFLDDSKSDYIEWYSGGSYRGQAPTRIELSSSIPAGSKVQLMGNFTTIAINAPGITVSMSVSSTADSVTVGQGAEHCTLSLQGCVVGTLNLDSVADIIIGQGSSVEILTTTAGQASVALAEGCSIGRLDANSSLSVSGRGDITLANINANGVSMETRPKKLVVAPGVTGANVPEAPSTPSDPPPYIPPQVEVVSAISVVTTPFEVDGLAHNAGPTTVTLTTATSGASIYYTTDGTTPTIASTEYSGAFTVTNPGGINGGAVIVKAIGVKSGMEDTAIAQRAVVYDPAMTLTVNSAAEFVAALEANSVHTIYLGEHIAGDVTATRTGSSNFSIQFGIYSLTGNLNITADSVANIGLTGTAHPTITGNLVVSAALATVTNGIVVGGSIIVSDVGDSSWIELVDDNTIIVTDSNGATIVISGNPSDITIVDGANGIAIEANTPVTITVNSGATVSSITASESAAGTSITNNGTVSNVTANADVAVVNYSSEIIMVSGSGTVAASGTGSFSSTGSAVLVAAIASALGVDAELRIGSTTTTANITGVVTEEGETLNVTSANAGIIHVADPTLLLVTAKSSGRTAVTVQVKNASDEVTKQGVVFITVLPELMSEVEVTMEAPATGATPQTAAQVESVTGNADYTITRVSWNEALAAGGVFKADQVYTATIEATAKNNKTFGQQALVPVVPEASVVGETSTVGTGVCNRIVFTVTFPATAPDPEAVEQIEVTNQPSTTEYASGDALSLAGLVITATHYNGETEQIIFGDDGTAAGYTTAPVNGATLTTALHGQGIVVTHTQSGQTATTVPIGVSLTNYLITYHLDGGTNFIDAPAVYNIESPTITLGTPAKAGFIFAGWFDAASGGTEITAIPLGSTGGRELWAFWRETPVLASLTLSGNPVLTYNGISFTYDLTDLTLAGTDQFGAAFTLTDLPVTWNVASGPASVSGSTLTITNSDKVLVTATVGGVTSESHELTVGLATPALKSLALSGNPVLTYNGISFTYDLTDLTLAGTDQFGAAFTLTDLPVTWNVASGPASVSGSTLTITNSDKVLVTATVGGVTSESHELTVGLATPALKSLALSGNPVLTYNGISFTYDLTDLTLAGTDQFGAAFTLTDLPVTWNVASGPASVSGSTLTITNSDKVLVTATVGGVTSESHELTVGLATPALKSLALSGNPVLTYNGISFTYDLTDLTLAGTDQFGAAFTLTDLPVTWNVASGPASVSGSTLTITNSDKVLVTATVGGVTSESHELTVGLATPALKSLALSGNPVLTYNGISFTYDLTDLTLAGTDQFGAAFTLTDLPVTWNVASGPASVSGSTLTITNSDKVLVTATVGGVTSESHELTVGLATPALKSLALSGNPVLTYNGISFTYDLTDLTLAGTDQFGAAFTLTDLPVTWNVASGPASVSGSTLTITNSDKVLVTATVGGVTSESHELTVGLATPALKSLALSGNPVLTYNGISFTYDLTDLTLAGTDQFGAAFTLTDLPVTWNVASGPASVSGSTLTITNSDKVLVTATVGGVTSESHELTVGLATPALKSLALSGNPVLTYNGISFTYDLTDLTLAGTDQFGAAFTLTDLPVTWNVASGPASVSGSTLTITNSDKVLVTATVGGVTSESHELTVGLATPALKSLALSGNPVLTYNGISFTYDLTDLTLAGTDQFGAAFTLTDLPVTWNVASGPASVSGSTLTITNSDKVLVTATVGGVTSESHELTVGLATPALKSLALSGNPVLTYNGISFTYDLTDLTLAGTDQFGVAFTLTDLPVTWNVASGPASVSGSTLTITNSDKVLVTATVGGVTSESHELTVGLATPALKSLALSGNPVLTYNGISFTYDLTDLTLAGTDQFGAAFTLTDLPVTWNVASGPASVSGSTLTITNSDKVLVTATVGGVTSESHELTVGLATPALKSLALSGNPVLTYNGISFTYDLTDLTLAGTDQFGAAFTLTDLPVTWNVASGPASVSGSTLTITNSDKVLVTATVGGVTSESHELTVGLATPALKSLALSGNPVLTYNGISFTYDLTDLTLAGTDQFGAAFTLTDLPVTWNVASGPASVSGSTLTITNSDKVLVTATVGGVTSESHELTVGLATPALKSLALSGNPVLTYNGISFTYDLTDLTLAGTDQFGAAFTLTDLPVTWNVASGPASVSGSTLTITNSDKVLVTATVGGVTSESHELTVGLATPALKSLALSGNPVLTYNGISFTYDLTDLTLAGTDQFGVAFTLTDLPVTWNVASGPASVSGSTLTITNSDKVLVTATVGGVTSESHELTVGLATPALKSLALSGNPVLTYNGISFTYDLTDLTLAGTDQFGAAFTLTDLPVTWNVASGPASVSGSTLTITNSDKVLVTATVGGVTSESHELTVGLATPALKSLALSGNPVLTYNGISFTYDLTDLTLAGTDQFGAAFTLTDLPVTWNVASGPASVSGSTLTITNSDKVLVTATVGGVTSESHELTVGLATPALKSLALSGNPVLTYNGISFTYDLTDLTLAGTDQFGAAFTLTDLPVTWNVASGPASVSGSTLTITNSDKVLVTATVGGVTSESHELTVGLATPALKSLALSGNPVLTYNGISFTYDLTDLTLAGTDQFGAAFTLTDLPVTWNVASGPASVSGSTLTITNSDKVLVTATVGGVTSESHELTVGLATPALKSLALSGSPTLVYNGTSLSYDLSKLTLAGFDQFGAPLALTGQTVTWGVVSGPASLALNTLTITNSGTVAVTATVGQVASDSFSLTVGRTMAMLKSLNLGGNPTLTYNGSNLSFDLSELALTGADQFAAPFSITGRTVTWGVLSGPATVSGKALTITNSGTVTVRATINDVQSNSLALTVGRTALALVSLTLSGSPVLTYNGTDLTVDLNSLTLAGADQYGQSYDLSSQIVNWNETSDIASISGSTLTISNSGTVTLSAVVGTVKSGSLTLTVNRAAPALARLTLSGSPVLTYNAADLVYDLRGLALAGVDQFGTAYSLTGQAVIWSETSDIATVVGNVLTIKGSGTVTVKATLGSVSSPELELAIATATPLLASLNLSGSPELIYIAGLTYGLNNLTLVGNDQHGHVYDVTGQTFTWTVQSGPASLGANGHTLTITNSGTITVNARVNGIISNNLELTVSPSASVLTSLTLSGSQDQAYHGVGLTYDLSRLTLTGTDQYGQPYDLTGEPVTWALASGSAMLGADGHTLTVLEGAATVNATVGALTSNNWQVTVQVDGILLDRGYPKLTGWWNNEETYGIKLSVCRSAGYVDCYYLLLPAGAAAPTAEQVKEAKPSATYMYGVPMNWGIYPVEAGTEYTLYIVAEYSSGNLSAVEIVPINTTVTAIVPPADVAVNEGTSYAEMLALLPAKIKVVVGDNLAADVDVSWDGGAPAYDGTKGSSHLFTGTLNLPGVLANPGNLQPEVNVSVTPFQSFAPGYPQTEVFDTSVNLLVKSRGDMVNGHYVVLTGDKPAPSAAQVIAKQDGAGNAAAIADNGYEYAQQYQVMTWTISSLSPGTTYNIYIVGTYDGFTSGVQAVTVTTAFGANTTVTEVAALADILVELGTDPIFLRLDDEVMLSFSNGAAAACLRIGWDAGTPAYDPSTPGTYLFTGSLDDLPQGVANISGLTATQSVIVADTISPALLSGYPKLQNVATDAIDLTLKVSEVATAYYVVLPAAAPAPSAAQVIAGQDSLGAAIAQSGSVNLAAGAEAVLRISGLTSGQAYKTYVVAQDAYSNASPIYAATSAQAISDLAYAGRAALSSTDIFFTWTPPADADSVVLYYKVGSGEYVRANSKANEFEMKTVASTSVNGLWESTCTFKLVVSGGPNAGQSNEVTLEFGFAGGSGTVADPYLVTSAFHLDSIRYNWWSHYRLAADIDLGADAYTTGQGWRPILDGTVGFSGVFDGDGHTISNLTITRIGSRDVGLFAYLHGGTIRNLNLAAMNTQGSENVAGLVGHNNLGRIEDCSVTGQVAGVSGNVGGLVGLNESSLSGMGTIDNCSADVIINQLLSSSASNYGGLVGWNVGATITDSSAAGTVYGGSGAGGLVGRNSGKIIDSSASATVSGTGEVGGLVGSDGGEIITSSASGTVSGGNYAGGLVGFSQGTIQDSAATGAVTGGVSIGGLAGRGGVIIRSFAAGTVTGESQVGGLTGQSRGSIESSFATGNVIGTGSAVGGLVGENWAAVAHCYASGTVTGAGPFVGGLAGNNGYLGENGYYATSAVTNSSALNPSITRAAGSTDISFGRIVGVSTSNSQALSGNSANAEMVFIGIEHAPVAALSSRDGADITLYAAKNQAHYQEMGWGFGPYSYSYAPWQMPADGYPALRWQPTVPASIAELSGSNGIVTMAFDRPVSWLSLPELSISAKLNGNDYTLQNLNIDPSTNTVSFTPVTPSDDGTLAVTIVAAAGSTKIVGTSSVTISTQIAASDLATNLQGLGQRDDSTAIVLKASGFDAEQIATALEAVYLNDVLATAKALQAAGFGAVDLAQALLTVYATTSQATVAMLGTWFGAGDLAAALRSVYQNSGTEAAFLLKTANFNVNDITGALRTGFGCSEAEVAVILTDRGFTALQISAALRIQYSVGHDTIIPALHAAGFGINQLAEVLQAQGMNDANVVSVLRGMDYGIAELAAMLQTVFGNSAFEAARVLGAFILSDQVTAFREVYNCSASETAQVLRSVGHSARTVAEALRDVYLLSATDVGLALQAAEYAATEVRLSLVQLFGFDGSTTFALKSLNYGIADIATILQSLGSLATAQLLQSAGYTSVEVAGVLKDVFAMDAQSAVSDLRQAGFDASASASALQSIYLLTDGVTTADLLRGAAYQHAGVGAALQLRFSFTALQTAQYLAADGASASEVAVVLKDSYQLGIAAAANMLLQVDLWMSAALALQVVYGADAALAAQTLQAAGLETRLILYNLLNSSGLTDQQAIETLQSIGLNLHTDIASAYLSVVGDDGRRPAIALRALEYELPDVANFLKSYYGTMYARPANALKAAGYSALETTSALKDTFVYSTKNARAALWTAGYDSASIIAALREVYGADAASAAIDLKAQGISIGEITLTLKTTYNSDADAAAAALHAADYTALEIAVVLRDAAIFAADDWATAEALKEAWFGVADVAIVLKDICSLAAEPVAKLLKETGFTAPEVAGILNTVFSITEWQVAADILLATGFSANGIAVSLNGVYTVSQVETATTMFNAGYDASSIALAIRSAYSSSNAEIAALLRVVSAGFTISDFAAALQLIGETSGGTVGILQSIGYTLSSSLQQVFGTDQLLAVQGLRAAGVSLTDIAAALQAAWGSDALAVSTTSKQAGFGATDVAIALHARFASDSSAIVAMLQARSYTTTDIAVALKTVYQGTADGSVAAVAENLRAARVGFSEIATALKEAYGASCLLETVQFVQNASQDASVATGLLKDVFTQTLRQAAEALKAIGVSIADSVPALCLVYGDSPASIALAIFYPWNGATTLDEELAAGLKAAGYDALEICEAMNSIKRNSAEQVDGLSFAGFGITEVLQALQVILPRMGSAPTVNLITNLLLYGGYDVDLVVATIMDYYGNLSMKAIYAAIATPWVTWTQAVSALINTAGATTAEVALIMFEQYKGTNLAAQVLKDNYGLDAVAAFIVLRAAGYSQVGYSDGFGNAAKTVFECDTSAAVGVLKSAGFPIAEVSTWLGQQSGQDYFSIMKANGYTLVDLVSYDKAAGSSASSVLYHMAAYYPLEDLTLALRVIYGLDAAAVTTLLLSRNLYTTDTITAVVSSVYSVDPITAVLQSRKDSGSSAYDAVCWLLYAFNVRDANTIASRLDALDYPRGDVLLGLWSRGFSRETLASVMADVYEQSTVSIVRSLLAVEIAAETGRSTLSALAALEQSDLVDKPEEMARLLEAQNCDMVTVVTTLRVFGFSREALVLVLKNVYQKTDSAAMQTLLGLKEDRYARRIIETLDNTGLCTTLLQMATILKQAGYSADEVLGGMLAFFGKWGNSLGAAGYANMLVEVFGITGPIEIAAMIDGNYGFLETNGAMLAVFPTLSQEDALRAMIAAGETLERVLYYARRLNLDQARLHTNLLMTVYGITDPVEITRLLRQERSYDINLVSSTLQAVFPTLGQEDVFPIMLAAGYSLEQVLEFAQHGVHLDAARVHASLLLSYYGKTDPAEVATLLRARNRYQVDVTLNALLAVFPALSRGDIASVVLGIGFDNTSVFWAVEEAGADDSVAAALKQCGFAMNLVAYYLFHHYSFEEAIQWFIDDGFTPSEFGPEVISLAQWDKDLARIPRLVNILRAKNYTTKAIAEMFVAKLRRGGSSSDVQALLVMDLWRYGGYRNLNEIASVLLTAGGGYEDMVESLPSARSWLISYGRVPVSEIPWSATAVAQAVLAAGGSLQQIARGFVLLDNTYFSRDNVYYALRSIEGPAMDTIRAGLSSAQSELSDYLPDALPFAALRMGGFSSTDSARMMGALRWSWKTAVVNLMVAGYSFEDSMGAIYDIYNDALKVELIQTMMSLASFGSASLSSGIPWYISLLSKGLTVVIMDQLP